MEKREKKVTFSQFQKLGKVLMTPVMILPIAGILVGIGSAFTTKNIGGTVAGSGQYLCQAVL